MSQIYQPCAASMNGSGPTAIHQSAVVPLRPSTLSMPLAHLPISSPSSRPETSTLPPYGMPECPSTRPPMSAGYLFGTTPLISRPSSAASSQSSEPLRRRRRTTPQELSILEAAFARNPMPTPEERTGIAASVNMSARACQIWFQVRRRLLPRPDVAQNRRQKEKRDKEMPAVRPKSAPPSGPVMQRTSSSGSSSMGRQSTAPPQESQVGPIRTQLLQPRGGLLRQNSLFGVATGGRTMSSSSSLLPTSSMVVEETDRKLWQRMLQSDDNENLMVPLRAIPPRPKGPQRTNSLDVVAARPSIRAIIPDANRIRGTSSSPGSFLEAHYGARPMTTSDMDSGEDTDELLTPNTSVDVNPMQDKQLTAMNGIRRRVSVIMQDDEAAGLLLALQCGGR